MKRFGLQILAGILILSNSFSQTYYPFPESNTYWQYTYSDVPEFCPCMAICYYDQFKISGDTVIEGQTYHKLIRSGIALPDSCDEVFYYLGYQGAFRNDIENKKVWFVPEGESNESLLYEFGLEIGDTLSLGILNPYNYPDFWVEDIDSVEVGDQYRKRYIIRSQLLWAEASLYVIEGIGGQNLIEPFESWWYFEAGYTFNCVNISDSLVFPEGANCDLIVNTEFNSVKDEFEIFPNPSSGLFWIKNTLENSQHMSIEVYNCHGDKVEQLNSSEIITMLDLSVLPKGIYLLLCTSEEYVFKEKIIIQ